MTQPDSYSKRKRKYLPSPVKEYALEKGLRLFQPDSIRKEKDSILEIPCDLIVTAAYGQFVPKVLLVHPRLQAINVHGSLLPKYRGGAPIQRALIEGETKTGISIIYMTPKMDAGDILMQREIPIEDGDDADSLFKKLSLLGAEMILEAIDGLEAGTIVPVRQDEMRSPSPTISPRRTKSLISETARNRNRIRGFLQSRRPFLPGRRPGQGICGLGCILHGGSGTGEDCEGWEGFFWNQLWRKHRH